MAIPPLKFRDRPKTITKRNCSDLPKICSTGWLSSPNFNSGDFTELSRNFSPFCPWISTEFPLHFQEFQKLTFFESFYCQHNAISEPASTRSYSHSPQGFPQFLKPYIPTVFSVFYYFWQTLYPGFPFSENRFQMRHNVGLLRSVLTGTTAFSPADRSKFNRPSGDIKGGRIPASLVGFIH